MRVVKGTECENKTEGQKAKSELHSRASRSSVLGVAQAGRGGYAR